MITYRGVSGNDFVFSVDHAEGQGLILISIKGLQSLAAVAKSNKSKRSSEGPIVAKYYATKDGVTEATRGLK